MPVRFLARLSKYDKNHLGFIVPKYVKEFYKPEPGKYKGCQQLQEIWSKLDISLVND